MLVRLTLLITGSIFYLVIDWIPLMILSGLWGVGLRIPLRGLSGFWVTLGLVNPAGRDTREQLLKMENILRQKRKRYHLIFL